MAARRKMAAVLTRTFVVGCRNKSSAVSASVMSELEGGELTEWDRARPYSELPGPRPLPLLGNNWRFIPYIGDYRIQEVDKVCRRLHAQYGRVVKLASLLGRPDMVFLFDADDIERVFRTEELMPHRPSMPSLNYYKHCEWSQVVYHHPLHAMNVYLPDYLPHPYLLNQQPRDTLWRHGESWCKFRTKVQQPMLQPRTAKLYVRQVEQTAKDFVQRARSLKDENQEMPDDFINEIHKWSLESIARVALDQKLGCLDSDTSDPHGDTQSLIDAVTTFFKLVGILELKIPFWRLFNTPTWNKYIASLDTITSILYQLSLHPDKQQLLYEEIRSVLPLADTSITTQHLEKLTQVVFQHYVISNMDRYFPEPERFLPERWLKSGSCLEHASTKIHPFASLPFGYGRRMCVGRRFAELEIQTVITKENLTSARPYRDIPGPRPLPFLGNTWRLLPVVGQYQVSDLARISQLFHDQYGDIVKLSGLIGRPDLLFVYDADEIERAYRSEGPTPFRPSMPCLVHYKSSVRRDFFGDLPGVVGVLGCLDKDLAEDSEPQRIIDAAKYALRNVAILELKAPFWRYIPTPLWTKYVKNMDFFVEVCMKYIGDALERLKVKEASDHDDLSLLERILVDNPDPKIACILALDLILVGIDTISMAVCSILYQLATRPREQQKLYEELVRVLPSADTPLNYQLLDSMVYLKAFVKEVFRQYSTVIGNGRTLQQDAVICGYRVPKGVQLVFPTIVTGNMARYVSKPDVFQPERWFKQSDTKLHPFASLPYGHGARMCLGRRFADTEIQVLLAKLIRSYKLEFQHAPLDYKVTFMYAPDGALRFKMTPRC
uniref:Cytochrome P450 n=1 Tax=Timema tahoe TaxID=61484 RepID=A0A7R9IDK5_9NEOP|nr:unnamed protein product [Timema tahoe]